MPITFRAVRYDCGVQPMKFVSHFRTAEDQRPRTGCRSLRTQPDDYAASTLREPQPAPVGTRHVIAAVSDRTERDEVLRELHHQKPAL